MPDSVSVQAGAAHAAAYPEYFADPFVLRTATGYIAYGTVPAATPGAHPPDDGRQFQMLTSPDLVHWSDAGGALVPVPTSLGTDYWAPEVAHRDGRYWLYYSLGHGDHGHHLRVAVADDPTGPFQDTGVNLTPGERFAIDAHPYRDTDGTWYLFYAHDVLTGPRIGTMLAVDRLIAATALAGEATTIVRPDADWQIYERSREMYGRTVDWHTLEGPSVVCHNARYYCLFSGGSWKDASYGVSWAEADHPLGPWRRGSSTPRILWTIGTDVVGPGHNSITVGPHGEDVIVYHAWNWPPTARQLHLSIMTWTVDGPRADGFPEGEPPERG
ncbi:glycoside hydrolase family 43 protein [Pengzhenrongella phosphoraccumulans]|uniref:glycoside hydrolase family 43 protein n=1 Tax=Pengzhenrongella phosphoraccumulans TaxID=3114394 RepID=UPI00388E010C